MSGPVELGHAESPYLAARREWNERYGDYLARAHHWRLVALGSLLVSAILAAGLVWQARQSRIVPYVVEVDQLGQAVAVKPAERTGPTDPRVIKAQLAAFITWARTISTDTPLMKAALWNAYGMSGAQAKAYLDEYYQAHSPFDRADRETVAVEVNAVLPLTEQSYQVTWTETARDLQGRPSGQTHWQASLTILINPPRDEKTILSGKNPLGIYVNTLNWTQKL
ncbi:MAG TPA: conjugal transfer protein TrbF [Candidatus Competibacteraceae bacterium]|nr:conjugal transfer protein TrbF [Candidatus Competibacteraceae bacterium]